MMFFYGLLTGALSTAGIAVLIWHPRRDVVKDAQRWNSWVR